MRFGTTRSASCTGEFFSAWMPDAICFFRRDSSLSGNAGFRITSANTSSEASRLSRIVFSETVDWSRLAPAAEHRAEAGAARR